ncbi:Transmembrane protein 87B, partial [Pristimantis euphronides]
MAAGHVARLLAAVCLWRGLCAAVPERGTWNVQMINGDEPLVVGKILFNGTDVHLKLEVTKCPSPANITVKWYLRYHKCYNEFSTIKDIQVIDKGSSEKNEDHSETFDCSLQITSISPRNQPDVVAQTQQDGPYAFAVCVTSEPKDSNWGLTVSASMKGPHGYISASEWPLMIFYMVMCIMYIVLGLMWFVWSACYWKDLLRIQFWIAAVIFLGMLEKAVFYAEYQNINSTGVSSPGLLIFAELVSAVKRTLARLLVTIVSLGYGIVK